MASYHKKAEAKHSKDAHEIAKEQHLKLKEHADEKKEKDEEEQAVWQALYDGWEVGYEEWLNEPKNRMPDAEEYEIAPPVEPVPLPDPELPDPPTEDLTTYESRKVTSLEKIETPIGTIIVTPGRHVLTGSDGSIFALSEQELAAFFQPA